MNTVKQNQKMPRSIPEHMSYTEVISFLDMNWSTHHNDGQSLDRMKKLDSLFSNPSKKLKTISVGGTNGKSLTAHFTAKLLRSEGLTVGTFYSPHVNSYNERISLNNTSLSNENFTELANEVILALKNESIEANTYEILTQMALNYFVKQNSDVVILETADFSQATAVCNHSIVGITRITAQDADASGHVSEATAREFAHSVQTSTHVISADQNKDTLKAIESITKERSATWHMPIRKLVPLEYPFEQLHGRCAALAERIASVFINEYANQDVLVLDSLLTKKIGKRGRPTLAAKKEFEKHPKRTLSDFWKMTISDLPARFQLIDHEKPMILLDTATNIDALENTLLGTRLLHYKNNFKGLTIILSAQKDSFEIEELSKRLRYFFKKTPGQVLVCPLNTIKNKTLVSWDAPSVADAMTKIKIKAKATATFKEAFDQAKKSVNEHNGLIIIVGPAEHSTEYWNLTTRKA